MSNSCLKFMKDKFQYFKTMCCNESSFIISYLIALFMGLTGLSILAINYLMKDILLFSPSQATLTNSISYIPWMVKPIFGLTSDSCPIFGYKRKPYLVITSTLFILSYVSIYLYYKTVWVFLFSIFLGSTCLAFCSVIGEALIVESSNQKGNDEATVNVSNFYIIKNLGAMVSSFLGGYLLEVLETKYIFLISSGLPFIILISSFFLNDKKVMGKNSKDYTEDKNIESEKINPDEQKNNNNEKELELEIKDAIEVNNCDKKFAQIEALHKDKSITKYSKPKLSKNDPTNLDGFEKVNTVFMCKRISSLKLDPKDDNVKDNIKNTLNNSVRNTHQLSMRSKHGGEVFFQIELNKLEISKELKQEEQTTEINDKDISCSNLIKMIKKFIFQKHIYKPIIFILAFCSTPSYDDAMFYFYTNELKFKKEMIGSLNFIGTLTSIIGIYLYKKWLYKYSFKSIIISSTLIYLLFNLLTLILVFRLNKYLGIPDFFFSVTANSITNALAEINTMPLLVITANMCPKNIEGTTYALLMSVIFLGYFISYQFGGLLNYLFDVSSENFSNLWMVILSSNLIALFQLPMIYCVEIDSKHEAKIEVDNKNVELKENEKKVEEN